MVTCDVPCSRVVAFVVGARCRVIRATAHHQVCGAANAVVGLLTPAVAVPRVLVLNSDEEGGGLSDMQWPANIDKYFSDQ